MKRPWLQIHLSTAIVLMFVAGGAIWANIHSRTEDSRGIGYYWDPKIGASDGPISKVPISESDFWRSESLNNWGGDKSFEYGWPYLAMKSFMYAQVRKGSTTNYINELPKEWHVDAILINGLLALTILFAVWFGAEWHITKNG